VCLSIYRIAPGYLTIVAFSSLIGGFAARCVSGRWQGWVIGGFLGFACVTIAGRIALEFVPYKGAPALPFLAYIGLSFGAGVVTGILMNLSAKKSSRTGDG
jgi:hypothetical protein